MRNLVVRALLWGALTIFTIIPSSANAEIPNEDYRKCIMPYVVYEGETDIDNGILNFHIKITEKLSVDCLMVIERATNERHDYWVDNRIAQELTVAIREGQVPGLRDNSVTSPSKGSSIQVRNAQSIQYFLKSTLGTWQQIPDTYTGPVDNVVSAVFNMGELAYCRRQIDMTKIPVDACYNLLGSLIDPDLAS